MLFGLFDAILPPGKIELTLNKYNFVRGEKITGHVKLTTKRPIKARGVFVRIYAVKETRTGRKSRTDTVFEFSQPLEQGDKEYTAGEYDFELVVPGGVGGPQLPQQLQTAVTAIGMLTGGLSAGFVKWYVEAHLDIPSGMDVSKKVQINVG